MKIPIPTIHLFPVLDELLLEALRSLSPTDWAKPTIVPRWTIKAIAAHLLDGNLRSLSMLRDRYYGESPGPINSYQDLVDYLNRLNADWVQAMQRISPALLIELLALTGKPYHAYLQSLDPFAKATFSVAWAGEQESANWFHIAREYTEKWHHQQQIRLAIGQEQALYRSDLYRPYLETSMRALPHHYRDVPAQEGDTLQVSVTGSGGGDWFLHYHQKHWQLRDTAPTPPLCTITLDGSIAWRFFSKGISHAEARPYIQMVGRADLGEAIFGVLAVMG
ncbi:MAG TPA: maleylpyruvate isomerase N-terminal domain-containing protein [Saprospiraceae bacterium]|nr:maleylpyruvate isomerase N-terminal domain-containing protein [Saprospiraceae bacterium]HMQ84217.1 maleylpyruvate isomerase N-terminal domain-containing protein [Saprospiraceae bacterium]